MQRQINPEIRHYEESVFLGMSLRQTFWSGVAVAIVILVYLKAKPVLGQEMISWVCMVVAAPFAAMGFFTYDGMSAWEFAKAVFRTEVRASGPRLWKSENRFSPLKERKKSK